MVAVLDSCNMSVYIKCIPVALYSFLLVDCTGMCYLATKFVLFVCIYFVLALTFVGLCIIL